MIDISPRGVITSPEIIRDLGIERTSRSELLRYKPELSWFTHDPGGIHGVSHTTRNLVLGELEVNAREVLLNESMNREAIRLFSITHDLKRLSDEEDIAHGLRSAHWVNQNLPRHIPENTRHLVAFLNFWHVPPDSLAPIMLPELEVAKNIDGADRVRTGDLDPTYMRGYIARTYLPQIASELFAATKNYREIPPEGQFEFVLEKAINLGYLIDR